MCLLEWGQFEGSMYAHIRHTHTYISPIGPAYRNPPLLGTLRYSCQDVFLHPIDVVPWVISVQNHVSTNRGERRQLAAAARGLSDPSGGWRQSRTIERADSDGFWHLFGPLVDQEPT